MPDYSEGIQVVQEITDHHNGSIYCVDWSRNARLIATGSNDKLIKVLLVPNFDDQDKNDSTVDIKELDLVGHKAIVRSVCFNPMDPTCLLSGGLMEKELKVWDTQSGQNVANLIGHQGDIYSVKASYDGSFAVSVGVDKAVKLWDIRSKSLVGEIDGSHLSEMYEICLCSNQSSDPQVSLLNSKESMKNLASVVHQDGTVSIWDLNMRKCLVN